MKVYVLMVEYTNFEDIDNNYSEIRGVYESKKRADSKMHSIIRDVLEYDSKFNDYPDLVVESVEDFDKKDVKIVKEIKDIGYIELIQKYGNGLTRIFISEEEVK